MSIAPTALAERPTVSASDWIKTLRAYRSPILSRSLAELAITVFAYFALFGAGLYAASVNLWFALPFCLIGSGFLVRLFLIQHDCSHGAFFKHKSTNDWVGRVLGIFTLTPYEIWQSSHLTHHSKHGNLDHRGIGDVFTLTVEEFKSMSWLGRVAYRSYRNPLVLFGLGPIFVFIIQHRVPVGLSKRSMKHWWSAIFTNLALAAFVCAGIWAFGWAPFLLVILTTTSLAAMIGVWLFYVQHQFEDTVWDKTEDWQVHDAALYGSTHLELPFGLSWLTANIGIHHIHHLYSKIPFYRLAQVMKDHPGLNSGHRLTLLSSLKTVRLKLWDPESRKLVSFRDAGV